MQNLISSLRRIGVLFLLGFLLICSLALGIIYVQQTMKQKELRDQVAKLSITAAQPLPSAEKLKSEYEEVLDSIPPADPKVILETIVDIARWSGIDVAPESEKFLVPPQNLVKDEKVGNTTYQVFSFRDIKAQGDYGSVMEFVSRLESGETLKTAVVKNVNLTLISTDSEGKPEFSAVITMDVYTKRKG